MYEHSSEVNESYNPTDTHPLSPLMELFKHTSSEKRPIEVLEDHLHLIITTLSV